MLVALAWWTVLLMKTQQALYDAQTEIVMLKSSPQMSDDAFTLSKDEAQQIIDKDHQKKRLMIIGESIVFAISLIIGLYFIQKSYQNSLQNSRDQHNFLLSVTHELKSPLAAIRLIAETFQRRHLTPEQSGELQNHLLSETQRLEALINNILLASKIQQDLLFHPDQINVKSLLESIVQKCSILHKDAQIQLEMNDNIQAFIDKDALVIIFNNLVENAIKYSMPQPKIEINVSNTKSHMRIQVKDNGIGIPDHEKQKIFQRFYRVGEENTRKTSGTGLGLYIVKSLVDAMNGKIHVHNNTPKGTIFEVTLKIVETK